MRQAYDYWQDHCTTCTGQQTERQRAELGGLCVSICRHPSPLDPDVPLGLKGGLRFAASAAGLMALKLHWHHVQQEVFMVTAFRVMGPTFPLCFSLVRAMKSPECGDVPIHATQWERHEKTPRHHQSEETSIHGETCSATTGRRVVPARAPRHHFLGDVLQLSARLLRHLRWSLCVGRDLLHQ